MTHAISIITAKFRKIMSRYSMRNGGSLYRKLTLIYLLMSLESVLNSSSKSSTIIAVSERLKHLGVFS